MMSRNTIAIILLGTLLLGGGTAAGGYLLGQGIVMARVADRSVVVKGLVEKEVRADLATWSIRYTATGNALEDIQTKMGADGAALREFLTEEGFRPDEITTARLEVTDLLAQTYRQPNLEKARYIVAQTIQVRSVDVARVDVTSRKIGDVVKRGIILSDNGGPSYFFTGLNLIKPDMIAAATLNARRAAARFAEVSGAEVGDIRHASQGVFQILPRDRGNQTQRKVIDKIVRVVATVRYALKR
ncbi:MAG: hypothetical protein ACI9JL_004318 [Paracoccaceae bacterium]|jgi:hypothetical protein